VKANPIKPNFKRDDGFSIKQLQLQIAELAGKEPTVEN